MEVIEKEEHLSSGGISISVERKQSLRARYVYGFIFLVSNLFAWVVRDYGHFVPSKINYVKACRNKDDCFHAEGVLRVSFGCFIFFLFMLATTYKTHKLHEGRHSWHSKWWSLKFPLWITSMVVPVLIPVPFIQIYGEIARFGAGCFVGLLLSTIFYVGSICGITSMYILYARGPACALNIFFITWTAILVKVMMIVSLHSKVNTGLLSSGIMGSYVIFLCWLAIRSEPTIEKHSSQRQLSDNGDWATVLSFLIAISAIVLATFSTGIDSKAFQFGRDNVQSEDDIPYKYVFFHFIFSIGSMYFAMLFISWELDHPTKKWSIDVGWASMWIKILNEWLAASIYLWTLIYPAIRSGRVVNPEESVQQAHSSA